MKMFNKNNKIYIGRIIDINNINKRKVLSFSSNISIFPENRIIKYIIYEQIIPYLELLFIYLNKKIVIKAIFI